MRIRIALGLIVAFSLSEASARADERKTCADAYESSQSLRDEGRLLRSREQLRVCARAECPGAVAKTCADWLAEIEQRIPSVVLSASSGAGVDRIDVRVTMDGTEVATKLEGRAVEIDPGVHTFVFEGADGRAEQQFVVKQGAKDQALAVMLGRAPVQAAVDPPALAPSAPESPASTSSGASPIRYVGYAAGGLGLVGLGLGIVFGLHANSKYDESTRDPGGTGCDANDFCGAQGKQARADAQSAGTRATVGFVAGGILLATGIALVVLAPPRASSNGVTAKLAPMIGAGSRGMTLGGTFQ
jgi:hypothetical protein